MKAQLGLEYIGATQWDRVISTSRMMDVVGSGLGQAVLGEMDVGPSVVEITPGGARKLFGHRDYSKSNGRGTRGVMVRYILESDHLYYVRSPASWRKVDEYYCAVREDGEIYRLSDTEVVEWLSVL